MKWFSRLAQAQKIAASIVVLILVIWAVWFVYDLFTASDKVKGRLGENQTEAAIESGSDAVETIGNQGASEGDIGDTVKEIGNEIDKADNPTDVDTTARDGLCHNFGICSEE